MNRVHDLTKGIVMFIKEVFRSLLILTIILPAFANAKTLKRTTASSPQRIIFHNTATVKIKEGELERYLNAAREAKVFKLTRQESGNISYLAYQNLDNPNMVIFNELWKNKEALDQHLAAPHMVRFFTAINFNPAVYDIKTEGTKIIFTPKSDLTNYVIAELVLDGFPSAELR